MYSEFLVIQWISKIRWGEWMECLLWY